jgi:hypothetical protein
MRYLKMDEINGNITSIEKIRKAEKDFIRKSDGNRPHTNDTEYKEYYENPVPHDHISADGI